jgi:hypothetical protein
VPESSINDLANCFLDYLAAVHYANAAVIRQLFSDNGGYVAHFDGTCEVGTDVLFTAIDENVAHFDGTCEVGTDILFTAIDEISAIVVLTCRMPTENVSDITQFFEKCKKLYDNPLATMRDLSKNIALARDEVFAEVADLICQYHFLENVGKALFKETHQQLTSPTDFPIAQAENKAGAEVIAQWIGQTQQKCTTHPRKRVQCNSQQSR